MENFRIEKLTVLSELKKISFSCNFKNGMNLLIGKNKTGKSSIIKSIFYSFSSGVNFDDFWEKNVNEYIVEFSIYEEKFTIRRSKKEPKANEYFLYKNNEILLGKYQKQDDLSEMLSKIFQVNFKLTSNKDANKELFVTPSLLFSYMYIDQHYGWSKIGEGFNDIKKYNNPRDEILKYIVGYLNHEYYELANANKILKNDLKVLENKHRIIEEFVKTLSEQIPRKFENKIISNSKINNTSIVKKLETMMRESFKVVEELEKVKNEIFKNQQEISQLEIIMDELQLDIEYARNLEDEVVCPYCGVTHENSINNKISIVNNYEDAFELRQEKIKDSKYLNEKLEEINKQKTSIDYQTRKYKNEIKQTKKNFSLIQNFKNEGKFELITKSNNDLNYIYEQIISKEIEITEKNKSITKLKSPKRNKKIDSEIKELFVNYSGRLSADTENVKFRSFKPTDKSIEGSGGSEGTRLILAYYLAIYTLNLSRIDFPFKFLVVDTPNQQGQDPENLENIYSLLKDFSETDGQIIIASERLTGFEGEANNFIDIGKTKKNTLSPENFDNHFEYLKKLDKVNEIE